MNIKIMFGINLYYIYHFEERGSRGWAVPLAVSVLRSPSRLRVSPNGGEEEEGRRGRSRPHLIIFIYAIQPSTKTYNMANQHTIVRRDYHRHHHRELSVNGVGSQASKRRQNNSFKSVGRTYFLFKIIL